jgi:Lon protease-like protein
MSHHTSPLEFFSGTARLFPLPNLVLFPHVVQPLHIFEPRYRQLMADALKGDRLMALALLRPGWEEDYHRCPSIYPVVCVGRIFQEEALPDGRYNLLLRGLHRARVIEELHTDKLYRQARVSLLTEVPVSFLPTEQCLRRRLGEQVTSWFSNQSATVGMLHRLLESDLSLGALCDIFSFALPLHNEFKQRLLEEVRVEHRARSLLAHLEARCSSAASASAAPRRFPPEFSTN